MLTDERALELWSGPGNRPVTGKYKVIAFARAIEAEVMAEVCSAQNSEYAPQDCLPLTDATQVRMEAQEPIARTTGYFGGHCVVKPISPAMVIPTNLALYTTPQPPAPCPKCAELESIIAEEMPATYVVYAMRDALQAKVAEQRAEIERLQSKLDLLVIERDAQAVLISDQHADVEKQTEISNNFAAQVRQQNETISSLRAEVDHRQSLLRESSRNCAEHAGVVWTQNVTIAQQAALIEKCERALAQFVDDWEQMNLPNPSVCQEALAAIAAHRSQS